jgi:hypothetical protein
MLRKKYPRSVMESDYGIGIPSFWGLSIVLPFQGPEEFTLAAERLGSGNRPPLATCPWEASRLELYFSVALTLSEQGNP